ncbi:hypothetical protein Cgig2_004545 [Carnegiea gigantea]|uniref:Ubiquitin-like protease family profile domain-containing protein n=1 Tax=Carnegiea gigantea TaxID=171969 RepID=A0A9Q1QFA5_9CARY|nr:hypothetical protein Cgig2_004545 [Carnegiea gigantea]
MKLRSEQEQRERPEGSNVTGECAMGEASAAVGKRKRRMSGAKLGSGDAQVSKIGEGVSGSRHTDKDGKGKGKREGKRLKEEVDGGKGRNGKGREKGKVAGDGGAGVGVSGSGNDVILRSRCTLRSICALHGRLTPYQRDAILGTVLQPVLEYGEMAMERHLTLALIQAWDRRRKAFRIAGREVRFTVFDVVLFTCLPGTGKKVELDREEVSTEVGDMVRARMGEWERKEIARRVVVDSIEDTQRKLCRGPLSKVQLNGLCLLIQVWFYEHTTIFSNQDGERYPRLASWRKVDHGGMYDATELLAELQESELQETAVRAYMDTDEYRFYVEDGEGVLSFDELLRRAREAYAKKKEANRRIRAEFVVMKDRLLELEGRLQEFGAGHGDAGQGEEAAAGATFSGATQKVGTSKPTGLGGAATQDPRSPPNDVNVNLSAETEAGRTCNEDVLEQGDNGNGQNVPTFATEVDVQSEPAVEGANERYEQARPTDIGDSGIASAAQAVHSPAEMAAEDANSVPPTTDSVPVSDGDAVKVNQPPIAGDRGHCRTTSTTTTAADVPSCPRSSNIVSRMKKLPRIQKPSRVRGSPYTNPMRGIKGGRKGLKSTASVQTGSGDRSPSTVQGEIVNDEDVSSVVPIAVERGDWEVDAHAHPDAAVNDDVPDTSTFGLSPHVPAPRTRGTGSTFVISEEGVKAYLTWPLSPTEVDLLVAVHARCKGLKDSQWNFDLPETSEKHVNTEFLKGLINVVPTRGAADRAGRYCIGAWSTCTANYSISVSASTRDTVACLPSSTAMIRYQKRMHFRIEKVAIGLALMKLAEFTDVLRWEMEHADCPQQDNGHDCGVYMLMFMDLLSIRADGVYFGQNYVRHARDKLLLSLLQGSIAHFPQAFLQGT